MFNLLRLSTWAVVILSTQAFWWLANFNGENSSQLKNMPGEYYQPIVAYPSYYNHYNPYLYWPNEFSSQSHPSEKTAGTKRKTKPSTFQKFVNSLLPANFSKLSISSQSGRNTANATVMTTIVHGYNTTSSTTSTTTSPSATIPEEIENLGSQPNTKQTPSETISRHRNDISFMLKSYQESKLDVPTQRVIANYLAQKIQKEQSVQFIPCMCPVSLNYQQSTTQQPISDSSIDRILYELNAESTQ